MTSDHDDLSRRLSDRVDSATPPIAPPYDGVLDRHARRVRRGRIVLAAGSVAVVVALVGVTASLADRDAGPSGSVGVGDTASPTPTGIDRPEPTYEHSGDPSPVVLRLADRDLRLEPWSYCWSGPAGEDGTGAGVCVDGFARAGDLEDIGSPESVDFWFGVEGWKFDATFQELGADCPRQHTFTVTSTGDQTFSIGPAGPPGRYRVDLFGRGSGGDVITSFIWTTPASGPIEQPAGYLALVTDDDDGFTSYGVELGISDLGFEPQQASARVTVTSAEGASATFEPRLEQRRAADCYEQGSLFFADRDVDTVAQRISALGDGPFDYRVALTVDGKEYVGTAVWPRDETDEAPNTELTFDPPLPAYTGD